MHTPSEKSYFTPFEIGLWCSDVGLILLGFFLFDREGVLSLIASLIGVTALILMAKGNAISQILFIVFSILYAIISCSFSYYGEMITYLCLSMPMAVIVLISWLRHPYREKRSQVEVQSFHRRWIAPIVVLTVSVTVAFYFLLDALGTENLFVSTLSVATSVSAVCLTALRSPYFALLYAANDLVLIVLWTLASLSDRRYLSVLLCFAAFFANDLYSFVSWKRMQKDQSAA